MESWRGLHDRLLRSGGDFVEQGLGHYKLAFWALLRVVMWVGFATQLGDSGWFWLDPCIDTTRQAVVDNSPGQ